MRVPTWMASRMRYDFEFAFEKLQFALLCLLPHRAKRVIEAVLRTFRGNICAQPRTECDGECRHCVSCAAEQWHNGVAFGCCGARRGGRDCEWNWNVRRWIFCLCSYLSPLCVCRCAFLLFFYFAFKKSPPTEPYSRSVSRTTLTGQRCTFGP